MCVDEADASPSLFVSPPRDRACEGRVSTAALKVGVMLMCGGELDDKLKCEEVCRVRACVRVCVSVCLCVCVYMCVCVLLYCSACWCSSMSSGVFKVFADSYGEITADVLGDILGYSIKVRQPKRGRMCNEDYFI